MQQLPDSQNQQLNREIDSYSETGLPRRLLHPHPHVCWPTADVTYHIYQVLDMSRILIETVLNWRSPQPPNIRKLSFQITLAWLAAEKIDPGSNIQAALLTKLRPKLDKVSFYERKKIFCKPFVSLFYFLLVNLKTITL